MKLNKDKIQKVIDSIKNTEHFQQALTHTSYCNESNLGTSYERLEFLGDRILNFYASLFIYQNFPDFAEGKMSKLQQLMVKESTLVELSKKIGLNRTDEKNKPIYLRLGEGETKNQGINKNSILADIFESFVAALYLEKGGRTVYYFLKLTVFTWIKGKENAIWDYKSYLQEYCQEQRNKVNYRQKEVKRIKNNQLLFTVEVSDELETFREEGKGHSKDEAEKKAAAKVIKNLKITKK
ncbi:ribonuclease III [endosymbiont GvMRE of Glomus versiforme]|uniref:ribonuclease III n=1 Tax=endosymbiont GvMRE of Glomus versiforme TaxID=2039283 RepID=UPI000ED41E7C|nr:ribonuclease III [endosymbiont GvMRE of Glomus versiforme]RHZ35511.1 Ribonuclease 3 [endosymbiont GvMRE of Glomus versiforme]